MDDMLFPALKVAHPGYAGRFPPFCPCDEDCDLQALGLLSAPSRVDVVAYGEAHGARVWNFQFASGVACDCPENRTVTGRLFEIDQGAPWIVIVPGYATGAFLSSYGPFERAHGRAVLRRGLNVALIDLPFHMGRRRSDAFSGEPFFTPDLRRSVHALAQSTADTLALCHWLSAHGPVGLWGTSLGGCVAGLTGAVEGDLGALVLMEPLDNAGEVLACLPAAWELRDALSGAGLTPEGMARAFRSVAPSSYAPAVEFDRILFITPAYDRIIPAAMQDRLWRAWGEPERLVLSHGHVTAVGSAAAIDQAVTFLASRLHTQPTAAREEGEEGQNVEAVK